MRSFFTAVGRHLVPGPFRESVVAAFVTGGEDEAARTPSDERPEVEVHALIDATAGASPHPRRRFRIMDGLVSGEAPHVRFGRAASTFIVVTGPSEAPAIALVEATAPSVHVEGGDAAPNPDAHVRMDRAPSRPTSPRAPTAFEVEDLRATMRFMIACELSGIARRMLDDSVLYARARRSAGRPIGSFQAVQHLLADMHVEVSLLDAAVAHAVASSSGAVRIETADRSKS
jgi:alkylation response protein AidB-like acyl-CoA dehydrogenase